MKHLASTNERMSNMVFIKKNDMAYPSSLDADQLAHSYYNCRKHFVESLNTISEWRGPDKTS